MGHRGFTTKRYLWISRPLWATYVGIPEQNPSSILISELIKVRNWVVENFDGISPGLLRVCVFKSINKLIQAFIIRLTMYMGRK